MSTVPPGWYSDPQQPGQLRWWDGSNWTTETQVSPAQVPQGSLGFQPTGSARPARSKRRVFVVSGVIVALLVFLGASGPLYQMVLGNMRAASAPKMSQDYAELLLRGDLTDTAELLQRMAAAADVVNPEWATSDTFMKALVAEHMPILLEPNGGVRSVNYGVSVNPWIELDPISGAWRYSSSAVDPGSYISEADFNEFVETREVTLLYKVIIVSPRTLRITATFDGTSRYGECSLTLSLVDGPPPYSSKPFFMSNATRHIIADDPVCRAALP